MSESPRAPQAVDGLRLGTTLFSLTNEFHSRRFTFEQLVAKVAELNLGPGLEIVGFQSVRGFPAVSDEFAARFRGLMAQHGLVPTCLGLNSDIAIRRDRLMSTEESVAYHEPQILAAAKLGFPVARYQFTASAEVVRRLVPLAERVNVKLGLEIHAPYKVNSPEVMAYREMYDKVNSPCLGFIPDFGATARTVPSPYLDTLRNRGISEALIKVALDIWMSEDELPAKRANFAREARATGADPAAASALGVIFNILVPQDARAWQEIMSQVIHVHAKFYDFNADGSEVCIPYEQILPVFRDAGYSGYMSSEWEGQMYSDADGFEMLRKHHALCRRILRIGT